MPEIVNPRTKLQEVKERYEPPRTGALGRRFQMGGRGQGFEGQEDLLWVISSTSTARPSVAAGKAKAAARKAAAAAAAQKALRNRPRGRVFGRSVVPLPV